MAGETTVGGIVGHLRLDADQFHREMERAIAEADHLNGKNVDVKVKADTGRARTELAATSAAADKVGQSGERGGRGMGALATAILTLGPATVPLAAATVGLAAGFGAMGTAGVLAIVGIRHEMQTGTATGLAFASALDEAKGDLNALSTVAAKGVLRPFQDTVANLSRMMPDLTRMIGDFSGVTGRVAGNLTSGLLTAFIALEPLMRDVGTYTYGLSQRFAALMSGPGVVAFGDYVRSVFPQVMQAVEDIVGAALHLVAALAPLGGGTLSLLQTFSQIISALPVSVLSALATAASAAFLGFKSYGLITGLISGVSSALVKMGISAGVAASGMAALNIAAAGIGAIVAVATFLYTRHAEAVRQDQAAVDSYTDALRQSNGAIDENVRATAFKQLQDSGAYDAAKRLGIGLSVVTDAALGNTDAARSLGTAMQNAAKAQNDFEAGGKRTGRTSAETYSAIKTLNETVGTNTSQFSRAQQAQKDWAAASQQSTGATAAADAATASLSRRLGTTSAALQVATDAQQKQADSAAAALVQMQLENDAAGILKTTLDTLNGKTLSAAEAQNAFDSSLANMGTHVDKTGKKITFTTTSISNMSAASVALRGQLNGQVSNLQRVVEANGGLANSTGKARAQMVSMRQQIINNAVAHGVDRAAVTAYIDKLMAIPKKVPPTKLDVDNATALTKLAAVKYALSQLGNKTVVVTTIGRYVNNGASTGGGTVTAGGSTKNSANGNIFKAFAAGGFEDHVAQIAPAGAMRLWAEPETGGEAYIPLASSKRGRSTQILAETNRLMGNPLGGETTELGAATIAAIAAAVSRVRLQTVVSAGSIDRALGAGLR